MRFEAGQAKAMVDPRRPHPPARPAPPRASKPGPGLAGPAEKRREARRATANQRADQNGAENAARQSVAPPQHVRSRMRARPNLPRPTETAAQGGPLARASSVVAGRSHRPVVGSPAPPTPWERVSATGHNVTTRMQERLRERRSAQLRLTALRWSKRLGVVAGAVGLGWVVALSPVFALDPEGTEASGFGSVVSPEQVAGVIEAYAGTSLVMLNVGEIAAQLEELVGVREAHITRVWPSALRVELVSSEPVAAIPHGGAYVLVDDRGETVDTSPAAPEQLPVITIPVGEGGTRILQGVLAVVDEIPVALRDRVEGIEAQTEDSISFVLRDGPRVEWGSGEQSPLKAEVLAALLDSRQTDGVDVIDVSAPSLPITDRAQ